MSSAATPPPPVRRIQVDADPTVVAPSTPGTTNGGHSNVGLAAPRRRPHRATAGLERMRAEELTVYYADKPAVKGVTLPVRSGEVLSLIGPSGCGKTTLLRTLNRLTELTATASFEGRITLDGEDVLAQEVTSLRRRVSMVFQQPNPFPMSVFDNVAYALREQASRRPGRDQLRPQVEEALRRAGLWDEVKDDLDRPALRMSGGQQQRLCIARALTTRPKVLLMDEPCSALDPIATGKIEDLIGKLRDSYTIVIVTHNMQQAARVSDHTAFFYLGTLVEYDATNTIFTNPANKQTEDYVTGRFG